MAARPAATFFFLPLLFRISIVYSVTHLVSISSLFLISLLCLAFSVEIRMRTGSQPRCFRPVKSQDWPSHLKNSRTSPLSLPSCSHGPTGPMSDLRLKQTYFSRGMEASAKQRQPRSAGFASPLPAREPASVVATTGDATLSLPAVAGGGVSAKMAASGMRSRRLLS